jgi:hypothetical protein
LKDKGRQSITLLDSSKAEIFAGSSPYSTVVSDYINTSTKGETYHQLLLDTINFGFNSSLITSMAVGLGLFTIDV